MIAKHLLCGSALMGVLAAVPGAALAQAAGFGRTPPAGRDAPVVGSAVPAQDQAAQSNGSGAFPDIIVTARRRAEREQDVPAAITAFSSKGITERAIGNQSDLANNTPSLIATAVSLPRDSAGFALRGQGPAFSTTPGTVAYFAEVPNGVGGIEGASGSYFDLASVEVLKGPQGTLFGKNATGGNILFNPVRPQNTFGGYAQAQFGNYHDVALEGAINVPLVADKLLLRVSGVFERRNGFTKDVGPIFPGKDYDDLNYHAIRLGLIFKPTDGIENYTLLRYSGSSTNGGSAVLYDFNPNAGLDLGGGVFLPVGLFHPTVLTQLAAQRARGIREVAYNTDQSYTRHFWQAINQTTIRLTDNLTLKNIASFSRSYINYALDGDGTTEAVYALSLDPSGGASVANQYWTEELQLQGTAFGKALNYVAGGFADRQFNYRKLATLADFAPLTDILGAPLYYQQSLGSHSKALFAQATLDAGAVVSGLKGLSVTAGYRYTWDNTNGSSILLGVENSGGGAFKYGSYNLTINYEVRPNFMLYAATRRALKSGGGNFQVPANLPEATYAPEQLTDYELGFKAQFHIGGAKVRVNADAFKGDYADVQRNIFQVVNGVLVNVIRNPAQAHVNGFEFQGEIVPVAGLSLRAAYSYIDAGYDSAAPGATVLQGAAFPFTPKHKVVLGGSYEAALPGALGVLRGGVNYAYQSSQSMAQNNLTQYPDLPGYDVVNMTLEWQNIAGRPLTISLYVNNVFNKTYVLSETDLYNQTFGIVNRTYGEPRMFGARLRYDF